jgi:microsomal dipeptidase-like Zn-dependent dipeptidase
MDAVLADLSSVLSRGCWISDVADVAAVPGDCVAGVQAFGALNSLGPFQLLIEKLLESGYATRDIEKIDRDNWLRVTHDTWHRPISGVRQLNHVGENSS